MRWVLEERRGVSVKPAVLEKGIMRRSGAGIYIWAFLSVELS